jgi:glycosyltransferase involved in cell wall biosynthesis
VNILFVNRMMGTAWGGGENYDYHLALGLQSLGHRVLLFTGCRWGERPPDSIGGLESTGVSTPYLRKYMYQLAGKVRVLPGLVAQTDLRLFARAAWGPLRRILRERAVDVVQILGIPHLAEGLLDLGYPTVMRFPGPPAWFQSGHLRRIGARRKAALFTHGDAVRYFRESVGLGVHEVPPGVDRSLFHPDPAGLVRRKIRAVHGFGADDFVLVTVGRLIEGKGHSALIGALSRRKAAGGTEKLVVVGDGPLRQRLEAQAAAQGLAGEVRFTGHLGKEQVARQLQAADCFCLFSEYENYSNAAIEAMAAGLPVLASRAGGFPLQIEEGVNGYLIDPRNPGELSRRLERLRSQDGALERLKEGARRFAERFEWRRTAERVAGIYERVSMA